MVFNRLLFFTSTGRQFENGHPALLFHSVNDQSSRDQSHITTETFRQFISFLQANDFETETIYQYFYNRNKNKQKGKGKQITLVFDDGFENFYDNVLPLLEKQGMKASVFPVVQGLDGLSTWDIYPPQKHLSTGQIREIAESDHEIGSHTLSHPDLALLDDKEIEYELISAKKILEDIIGKAVKSLSFPFGSWNYRVWRLALQCGYEVGVVYRRHNQAHFPIIPVRGVYAFDTIEDIIEKVEMKKFWSPVHDRDIIMPHFAKGTALWRFRKTYNLLNYFKQV